MAEFCNLPALDNLVDNERADEGCDGDEGRGIEPGHGVQLVLLCTWEITGRNFRFLHSFASIDVADGTYWFDQDSRVLSAKTLGFLQQKCAYFMVPKFVMPTQHNFCVLKEHFIFGTKQLL